VTPGAPSAPQHPDVGFWETYQPGFRFSRHPVGTQEFFREIEEHRYTLEPHIPEVVRFDDWEGKAVLEVGCGLATDGSRLARAGALYTGVDASPVAVELAQKRFKQEGLTASFAEATAANLPFPADSFDLVYSHGVIHHSDETEAAVGEFARVLRPGGTALVMVYHRSSLNYRFTILGVRRLMAAALLVPGASGVLARAVGEDSEVLGGHRALLRKHGLRYLADKQLFLSNNTDGPGNPLSKVYSRQEVERLFLTAFDAVETEVRYLNLRLYPLGDKVAATRLARRLERRIGWHLYVRATQPSLPSAR
jgi:ubiquinone/menaquinone biosynthesis C-methylase UbiE